MSDDEATREPAPLHVEVVEFSAISTSELGHAGYQRLCKRLGVPYRPEGYALLHVLLEGDRATLFVADLEHLRMWLTSGHEGEQRIPRELRGPAGDRRRPTREWADDDADVFKAGLEHLLSRVVWAREGWPDEWPT